MRIGRQIGSGEIKTGTGKGCQGGSRGGWETQRKGKQKTERERDRQQNGDTELP